MPSKSDFLEYVIQRHILRNTPFTAPLQTYIGLFTAITGGEASSFTEVTGGSYARQSSSFGEPIPTGTMANNAIITFPQATADWGTVLGHGVFDAVSAGNMLYWGILGPSPTNFASSGSDDQIYSPAHGLSNGDDVRVAPTPGGTLPTGLSEDTTLFVVSGSVDVLRLAATSGGVPIDIGAGSGIIAGITARVIQTDDTAEFASGSLVIKEN